MVNLQSYKNGATDIKAKLIPIIPPSKGHGSDVYTELGADKVLVYSRFDDSTKDFPTDTHFGQVGIIKNPQKSGATGIVTEAQFSSLSAIKLQTAIDAATDFNALIGVGITQTVTGGIARGTVASYDKDTQVLKYIQDRTLNLNQSTFDNTDFDGVNASAKVLSFENNGNQIRTIPGGSVTFNSLVESFTGITTVIGNKQINLGVQFTNGLANPEINKKSGDVIYIDNRKKVERNVRQKEDVKIILEF